MSVLLFFLIAFIVTTPILCGMFICVPKWWTKAVMPKFDAIARKMFPLKEIDPDNPPFNFNEFMAKDRQGPPIRWVWGIPLLIVGIPIGICIWYIGVLQMLVEKKCPYSTSDRFDRERVDWEEYTEAVGDAVEFIKEG